jgi:hypothetical protein
MTYFNWIGHDQVLKVVGDETAVLLCWCLVVDIQVWFPWCACMYSSLPCYVPCHHVMLLGLFSTCVYSSLLCYVPCLVFSTYVFLLAMLYTPSSCYIPCRVFLHAVLHTLLSCYVPCFQHVCIPPFCVMYLVMLCSLSCFQRMRTRETIYINAERQQFPHPQLLTPDDDQFGWNMSWKLLKWLAFIKF